MMESIKDVLIAWSIGAAGGALRFLSQLLMDNQDESKPINRTKFCLWLIVGGLFAILVFRVSLEITDKRNIQWALAYVGGALSPQLVAVLVKKIPPLVANVIDKKWDQL